MCLMERGLVVCKQFDVMFKGIYLSKALTCIEFFPV